LLFAITQLVGRNARFDYALGAKSPNQLPETVITRVNTTQSLNLWYLPKRKKKLKKDLVPSSGS
jgi:hypothetical protein